MSDKTYWCHKGRYTKQYEKLSATLVPASGKCDTVEGEILRAASKIYYDAYNNGFANNTSGAYNFLKLHDCLDQDVAAYLDENVRGRASGPLNETFLERMVDRAVKRVMSTKKYTPNEIDMHRLEEADATLEAETEDADLDEEDFELSMSQ